MQYTSSSQVFKTLLCVGLSMACGLPLRAADFFAPSDATWKLRTGSSEASEPAGAWRETSFNDSTWSDAPAPVYYSTSGAEPPFFDGGVFGGTEIQGMMDTYSTIFLRKTFVVANAGAVSELQLNAACDDGFIAWINGVEVVRYNVAEGEPTFDGTAANSVNEPAPLDTFVISNPTMLVNGSNVIAVQVFNSALNSSDIGFMAGLSAPVDATAPVVASQAPPAGATLGELTQIEVRFAEVVSGVDAADLQRAWAVYIYVSATVGRASVDSLGGGG
jgi:hypothetical protein